MVHVMRIENTRKTGIRIWIQSGEKAYLSGILLPEFK